MRGSRLVGVPLPRTFYDRPGVHTWLGTKVPGAQVPAGRPGRGSTCPGDWAPFPWPAWRGPEGGRAQEEEPRWAHKFACRRVWPCRGAHLSAGETLHTSSPSKFRSWMEKRASLTGGSPSVVLGTGLESAPNLVPLKAECALVCLGWAPMDERRA